MALQNEPIDRVFGKEPEVIGPNDATKAGKGSEMGPKNDVVVLGVGLTVNMGEDADREWSVSTACFFLWGIKHVE